MEKKLARDTNNSNRLW